MRTLEEQMCEAWEEVMYYGILSNKAFTTDHFSKEVCGREIRKGSVYVYMYLPFLLHRD